MALAGSTCQAQEVIKLLISNQEVKKKFLCQREQEQRASEPGSYTVRAGLRGVTGPFHLPIAAARPVDRFSYSQGPQDITGLLHCTDNTSFIVAGPLTKAGRVPDCPQGYAGAIFQECSN